MTDETAVNAVDRVQVVRCSGASPHLHAQLRALVFESFGDDFTEADWEHAHGGWHLLAQRGQRWVAHAAVVPRELHVAGAPISTGYVEAVATERGMRGRGVGSALLVELTRLVRDRFDMGALSTGQHHFYERAGWERWRGRTYVREDPVDVRTPEDDDGVMVLRHGRSAGVDLSGDISCDARPGDAW